MVAGEIHIVELDRRCCWITRNDADAPGQLVFLRFSDIAEPRDGLMVGEPITFEVVEEKRGARAIHALRADPQYGQRVKRLVGRVSKFDKGFGMIDQEDGTRLFVHHTQVHSRRKFKTLEVDQVVEYELGERPEGGMQALRVTQLDTRKPLERFASLGNIHSQTEELAKLAEPEEWGYQFSEELYPRPVLHSYLFYTFERIEAEGKIAISEDEQYACFNTGLVTKNQQEIFALFVRNRSQDREKWTLQRFCNESYRGFIGRFKALPQLANYFDDTSQLLYDRRCELFMDVEHILSRKDRFPEAMRQNEYLLKRTISDSRDSIKKRVYRNYKTAVPQFHRGKIQLLLPICVLTEFKADLALVVEKQGEAYRGNTVLSLDQAYNNARLIARPDGEWLQP